MDPEQLKAFMDALEGLRADIGKSIAAIDAKCDSLAEEMKKKDKLKADEAGERDRGTDREMAEPVAADSRADALHGEVQVLRDQVRLLQIAQPARQSSDHRNQMADIQAKADVAYQALGEGGAPPPFGAGEQPLDYLIRLTRPLLKHSSQFKSVDLHTLARDPATLNSICDSVRADAVKAGLSPVGMPEGVFREVHKKGAGGRPVVEFVGSSTIFKQLARPVRHVAYIGTRDSTSNGSRH